MRAHEVERLVPGRRHRRDDVGRETRVQEERRRAQERGRPRQGLARRRRAPPGRRPPGRVSRRGAAVLANRTVTKMAPSQRRHPGPARQITSHAGHEQEGEVAPAIPPPPLRSPPARRPAGRPGPAAAWTAVNAGKSMGGTSAKNHAPQARIGRVRRQAQRREPEGAPEPEGQRAGRGGDRAETPTLRTPLIRPDPLPWGSGRPRDERSRRAPWDPGRAPGSAGRRPPPPAPPADRGRTGGSARRSRRASRPRTSRWAAMRPKSRCVRG